MVHSVKQYTSNPPAYFAHISIEPPLSFYTYKGSDYDHLDDSAVEKNVFIDNRFKDLIYNKTIFDKERKPFKIYSSFIQPDSKSLMLKVQMLKTRSLIVVPYNLYKNPDLTIFDPYELTLFNHHCALGNINYEVLGKGEYAHMKNGMRMYNIWVEYMKRLYDKSHPFYPLYGQIFALPTVFNWHIFRYFYKFFDEAYYLAGPDVYPNPNDPRMYIFPGINEYEIPFYASKSPIFPSKARKAPLHLSYIPFIEWPEAMSKPKKRGPKRRLYKVENRDIKI